MGSALEPDPVFCCCRQTAGCALLRPALPAHSPAPEGGFLALGLMLNHFEKMSTLSLATWGASLGTGAAPGPHRQPDEVQRGRLKRGCRYGMARPHLMSLSCRPQRPLAGGGGAGGRNGNGADLHRAEERRKEVGPVLICHHQVFVPVLAERPVGSKSWHLRDPALPLAGPPSCCPCRWTASPGCSPPAP